MCPPTRTRRVRSTSCLLLALVAVLAAACSTSKPAATSANSATTTNLGATRPSGSWPYPNADLANTRQAPASVISSANVSKLQQAWTFRITSKPDGGVGTLTMSPVVVDGVVYIQDMQANVYALDLATGKLRWEYQVNTTELGGPGPDGVAVADGRVYGDAPHTAFALSAATGKPVWVDRSLLTKGQGAFDIQPQVVAGRDYLASSLGNGPGGGILLALDAATGKVMWKFNTIIGSDTAMRAVGAGGAWEPPLVGTDGSVTFGIGNPYQSPATAVAHPAQLLYADSEVNLDAATGKLRWFYQAVPNDFQDHDLQTSPIATTINAASAIIAAGKMGIVYAVNAQTGALLWKTPVGMHNGHDNDGALALQHKLHLAAPLTVEPGAIGGVLSNPAVADGSVYVAANDEPITYTKLNQYLGGSAPPTPTSEIEALNLATGKVEWDTKLPQMALGAATVSGDLVFDTLYGGELIALNRMTGAIVYRHRLPTTTNAPLDVFGNTVLVSAGGPLTGKLVNGKSVVTGGGNSQVVAYTVP
ncbi:MAG TPA: PQQ-binding-like beta-propeller repeat protein [Streptosporangiaceae bacterium]|nr:PQQ-binding-like beta-propeller repeat protein [Streptosporangiaceae bacterium]